MANQRYSFGPLRDCRYPGLAYQRRFDHWRILDRSGASADPEMLPSIGPCYGSKAELLADLDRFAADRGYD